MGLSRIEITIDAPDAPVVTIDGATLPSGVVQGIQVEQATPSELPQVILFMSPGHLTVNGTAVLSTESTDSAGSVRDFLSRVDVMALSEAAAALQGMPDPRSPGLYLTPTSAFLCALDAMCGDGA